MWICWSLSFHMRRTLLSKTIKLIKLAQDRWNHEKISKSTDIFPTHSQLSIYQIHWVLIKINQSKLIMIKLLKLEIFDSIFKFKWLLQWYSFITDSCGSGIVLEALVECYSLQLCSPWSVEFNFKRTTSPSPLQSCCVANRRVTKRNQYFPT